MLLAPEVYRLLGEVSTVMIDDGLMRLVTAVGALWPSPSPSPSPPSGSLEEGRNLPSSEER